MRFRQWAWSEQGTTEVTYLVSLGPRMQTQTPRWHVLTRGAIGGICKRFGVHLYFVGVPVATSIVIPILIGGSSGDNFGFNIPKSTTRMSDDNGHDKLVRWDYVGLAGTDEEVAWRSCWWHKYHQVGWKCCWSKVEEMLRHARYSGRCTSSVSSRTD